MKSVTTVDQQLLALSSEVALTCDSTGVVRWADARAVRVLSVKPETPFTSLAAPGAEDKARRFLAAALQAETESWELVLIAVGRPLLMTWRGAPVGDGAALVGNLVPQYYATQQDQVSELMADFTRLQRETERQRRELAEAHQEIQKLLSGERVARAQVETERARLQQILDNLPEAILIVDAEGVFAMANGAAAEVLGLEVVGQIMRADDSTVFGARRLDGSPISSRNLPLQRSALMGEVIHGEQLVVRHGRSDNEVPLLVNSAPLYGAGGESVGAVAVFQDITSIKEIERQKDEFLATVSHDLRNPLAGIKGWAQILKRRANRLPAPDRDRWQQDLNTIERAATRMAAMIDELLDLSHVHMRRPLELHREDTDLVQLVQRVVADHQRAATSHPIRVRTSLASLHGCWDTARLERVLGNLLSNAVKYSPEDSEIQVELEREDSGQEPAAVVSVRDRGVGIPAHDLPHVFERFYRASNVVGRIAGTGIGLAGARQLVEAHGGSIRVESTPGEGSTFVVHLPLSAALCEVD